MQEYIKSKTLIPAPTHDYVSRERLYGILDNVFKRRAVFLKAPAGYGKTTAITTWIHDRQLKYAWISLDENDNSLGRFVKYLYIAIGGQFPGMLKDGIAGISETDVGEAFDRLFFTLQNIRQDIILVLDDFHHITSPKIINSILRLMRYMPDELHFVFASRADMPEEFYPGLLKQKIVLLSEDTLLFNRNEMDKFFSLRNISLDSDHIEALLNSTEGWVCALIAVSMVSGEKIVDEPIINFRVKDYIFSFLYREVWNLWDDREKQFLLRTAILEEFSLDLAEKITKMKDCSHILECISSNSGFVITLDGDNKWYRYHHMFRDFLMDLAHSEPDHNDELLRNRAADYYRDTGDIIRALSYYKAAGNHQGIIHLIESCSAHLFSNLGAERVYQVISSLKPYGALNSLKVSICYAWSLQFTFQFIKARAFLLSLKTTLNRKKKSMDPVEYERAYIEVCAMSIPFDMSMNKDKRVYSYLETIFSSRHLEPIAFNLADALFILGSRATLMDTVFCFFGRVNQYIRFLKNRGLYDSLRDLYEKNGAIPVARAEVLYQLDRVNEAIPYLSEGLEESMAQNISRVYVPAMLCLANIQKARGSIEGAYETIEKCIEVLNQKDDITALPSVYAYKAKLDIEFNNLDAVSDWENRITISPYDEVTYHSLYQYIILAYVLIKTNRNTLAQLLLGKIKKLLDECPALGSYKILYGCLISNLDFKQGKQEKAREHMLRALLLGFKHGYYRSFADFGADIKKVLLSVVEDKGYINKKEAFRNYVKKIVVMNDAYIDNTKVFAQQISKNVDPNITPREIDILSCISTNLTNQEIAEKLFISLQTVKNHTGSIYQKLGVSNRMQAVARARELGVLK